MSANEISRWFVDLCLEVRDIKTNKPVEKQRKIHYFYCTEENNNYNQLSQRRFTATNPYTVVLEELHFQRNLPTLNTPVFDVFLFF